MDQRRELIAYILFVLDVLVCGIWVYWAAKSVIDIVPVGAQGSGGFAFAGGTLGLVDLFFTVVPPIVTIVLARKSALTRLARGWRNAHLVVMLGLIILPLTASLVVLLLSIVVFIPVQVFFAIGALAIWIASPLRQPGTSPETGP